MEKLSSLEAEFKNLTIDAPKEKPQPPTKDFDVLKLTFTSPIKDDFLGILSAIKKKVRGVASIGVCENNVFVVINTGNKPRNDTLIGKTIVIEGSSVSVGEPNEFDRYPFLKSCAPRMEGFLSKRFGYDMVFNLTKFVKLNKTIKIGDVEFKGVSGVKGYYGSLLKRTIIGERIKEPYHTALLNLVSLHKKKDEKLKDLDYFEANEHPDHNKTKCFFAVKKDGSKVDFSYFKCIRQVLIAE